MNFHYSPQQNYDCIQCGRSCQAGWDIPVEPHVEARMADHPLVQSGQALRTKRGIRLLNMTADQPKCQFLQADLLCSLHARCGPDAKPNTCRTYPYIVTHTPSGVYVGVSYSCSAARSNQGRPLHQQQSEIEGLLSRGTAINRLGQDGLAVHESWFCSWQEYCEWEAALEQRAQQVGWTEAISGALQAVAIQVAGWGRRRSSASAPIPEPLHHSETAAFNLDWLHQWLWRELTEHFHAGLEGVEASWRADYAALPRLDLDLAWSGPDLERYLASVVFRKQLVLHPTLLGNLCLLDFLPRFLGTYTRALARQRGRTPEMADYWDALDLAEKFLVYHCRGLRPLYHKAARALVKKLAP
jgi:Fe-S-cluster containining protein